MLEDGSFCLLSDFEKEVITYFRALTEQEQCVYARAIAAQIKPANYKPLTEHPKLRLVKGS